MANVEISHGSNAITDKEVIEQYKAGAGAYTTDNAQGNRIALTEDAMRQFVLDNINKVRVVKATNGNHFAMRVKMRFYLVEMRQHFGVYEFEHSGKKICIQMPDLYKYICSGVITTSENWRLFG